MDSKHSEKRSFSSNYRSNHSNRSQNRSRTVSSNNQHRKELPKIQSTKPKPSPINVKDITYEIREKITFSTSKTPQSNITTVNQMLENPRLYFSGRNGSNYGTPKGTNTNFRPSSKHKKHHVPGSYNNNPQYSKKDTNSILNDSILRNSRYYTAKNYNKNNAVYKNDGNSKPKYYSVDHKRGISKD